MTEIRLIGLELLTCTYWNYRVVLIYTQGDKQTYKGKLTNKQLICADIHNLFDILPFFFFFFFNLFLYVVNENFSESRKASKEIWSQIAWLLCYQAIGWGHWAWNNTKLISLIFHSSNKELPGQSTCPGPIFLCRFIDDI